MNKNVLLIVNTGTPDRPEVSAVRKFLSEFLNDKRVIDLPWILRKILVNLIIVPFRASRSTRLYRKVWTVNGSPLLVNLNVLAAELSKRLKDKFQVYGAMRYGNPSLKGILRELKDNPPEKIVVFPLYPHYASSTTGSVSELIMNEIQTWSTIPEIIFSGQFYSNPYYVNALLNQIKKYDPGNFDHILFSYHGLPLSHIQRIHPGQTCSSCKCDEYFPDNGTFCYRATCYETTRILAKDLGLSEKKFSTSFQSRLSKNWLGPVTDDTIIKLAGEGVKKILVVAPSFVADCLETIVEINEEYQILFKKEGGEELKVADSLNYNEEWVEAIIKIADI